MENRPRVESSKERSEQRQLAWTDDLGGRRETGVLMLDFEKKPIDPTSIVKTWDGRD